MRAEKNKSKLHEGRPLKMFDSELLRIHILQAALKDQTQNGASLSWNKLGEIA